MNINGLAEHIRNIEQQTDRIMRRQSGIMAMLKELREELDEVARRLGTHDRWERRREKRVDVP